MKIMHTIASEANANRPKRRFYSPELKAIPVTLSVASAYDRVVQRPLSAWAMNAPTTVGEMVEISEVRAVVFGFIEGMAAEHRSDLDIKKLTALVHGMDKVAVALNCDRYYRLNLEFHAAVVGLCGSRRAARVYSDFIKELYLFRHQNFDNPANNLKSQSEHQPIHKAISPGDKAEAAREAEHHTLAGSQLMLRDEGGT